MKSYLLTILAILFATIALQAKSLEFSEKEFDFGTVNEKGKPVVHHFMFKNVTDQPVVVLSASAQCGCTRPEYPVKPIAPGDSASIKVTFVPAGQKGNVSKDIRVRFRGAKARKSERVTLRLNGRVDK